MFNPKIFIPAAFVLIGGATYWFSILCSDVALFELFPTIPQKTVVKAHRIMIRRTLKGQYGTDNTDEQLNFIFLGIVKEIDPSIQL